MPETHNTDNNESEVKLVGRLAEFRQALTDEINEIDKAGLTSTILRNGVLLNGNNDAFYYMFQVDYAPSTPADTPCTLTVGGKSYDVTVVAYDESTITLSSQVEIEGGIGSATLKNGSTVLMKRLIKRIEENADTENPAGERLLGSEKTGETVHFTTIDHDNPGHYSERNNERQDMAIRSAISNDITYIWGPPGTGKTEVIGQIIDQLYAKNRTVLVVSHTNVAVDGAIKRACKNIIHGDVVQPCPILRLGNAGTDVPEYTTMKAHQDYFGASLKKEKESLETEETEVRSRLISINQKIKRVKWLADSRLEEILSLKKKQDSFEEELKQLKSNQKALQEDLDYEMKSNPEYSDSASIEKKLSETKARIIVLEKKIREIDQTLSDTPEQLSRLEEYLRRYEEISGLRIQLASHDPISTLVRQRDTYNSKLESLQEKRQQLLRIKESNQRIIDLYADKNFITRRLHKTEIETAEETVKTTDSELSQNQDDLTACSRKIAEFGSEISAVNALQQKIKQIVPPGTAAEYRQQLEMLQKQIPELKKQKISLQSEIGTLKIDTEEYQKKLQRLSIVVQSIETKKKALDKLQQQIRESTDNVTRCKLRVQQDLSDEVRVAEDIVQGIKDIPDENKLTVLLAKRKKLQTELVSVNLDDLQKNQSMLRSRLKEIRSQLDVIENKLNALELEAILEASVIGATLAKSYLSDNLWKKEIDTVILDEASMASIPALWCTSYLAKRNIIIVGDFLQLPPIVMAQTDAAKKWLGTDIFQLSGMQEACRLKKAPENFVALTRQYRMEAQIADIANLYYQDYDPLVTKDDKDRETARNEFYSWYIQSESKADGKNNYLQDTVHPIIKVDTEKLNAWVTSIPRGKNNKSRLNCFSAAISVNLAFQVIQKRMKTESDGKPKVLIVAPYKPHIDRIKKLIVLGYEQRGVHMPNGDDPDFIQAGTIHSFQGNEADVVIFDLVLDEPHRQAGLFLPNSNYAEINASYRKMFNVAVTRAKFKLFVVGNFKFLKQHARRNALSELLESLDQQQIPVIDAKETFPDIMYADTGVISKENIQNTGFLACRDNKFFDYLKEDLQNVHHRLIIYSPFMTESRLTMLLPYLKDLLTKKCEIILVTKTVDEQDKTMRSGFQMCQQELRRIGVKIVHKKKMHEKMVFIDEKAVWLGSLNVMSFTGHTRELMTRIADAEIVKDLEKEYSIPSICNVVSSKVEQTCPLCGKEMLVAESSYGGIYWTCSDDNCKYSRNPDQAYPYNGVLICKTCGSDYSFKMVTKPRWVCTENARHYQNLHLNDLRLPAMRAKLNRSDLKMIEQYFQKPLPPTGKTETQDNEQMSIFDYMKMDSRENKAEKQENVQSKSEQHSDKAAVSSANGPTHNNTVSENPGTPAKPVTKLNENGVAIATYSSINCAAELNHSNKKSIRSAVDGKQKKAAGFMWRYATGKDLSSRKIQHFSTPNKLKENPVQVTTDAISPVLLNELERTFQEHPESVLPKLSGFQLKPGEFVRNAIKNLCNSNYRITESSIRKLCDVESSRKYTHRQLAFLISEDDPRLSDGSDTVNRYWSRTYVLNGKQYRVFSEWYAENKKSEAKKSDFIRLYIDLLKGNL